MGTATCLRDGARRQRRPAHRSTTSAASCGLVDVRISRRGSLGGEWDGGGSLTLARRAGAAPARVARRSSAHARRALGA